MSFCLLKQCSIVQTNPKLTETQKDSGCLPTILKIPGRTTHEISRVYIQPFQCKNSEENQHKVLNSSPLISEKLIPLIPKSNDQETGNGKKKKAPRFLLGHWVRKLFLTRSKVFSKIFLFKSLHFPNSMHIVLWL